MCQDKRTTINEKDLMNEYISDYLDLSLPFTLKSIIEGAKKLGGTCPPDTKNELGRLCSRVKKLDNKIDGCEFEIIYNNCCSEECKIFAISRELYFVLKNFLEDSSIRKGNSFEY